MKKLLSLILVATAFVAGARQISPDEAAAIASDFLNSPSIQRASGRVAVQRARSANHQAEAPFYVFNADENHGFVIISGDDRLTPVLGYADEGNFDLENIPPQLEEILKKFTEQMVSGVILSPMKSKSLSISETKSVVLPTATWGQGYPFNIYAQEVDNVKCPSGCVATAMAIIMKYNSWPAKPRGKHSWISNGTPLSYDFDTVNFDFSQMPNKYIEGEYTEEQAMEVAKLMQAAGASVNMTYTPDGSGAMTCVSPHYLYENFRYSPTSQFISTANFSQSEWLNIIRKQIDADHPVLMNGYNETAGGHAFVCDGYNDEGYLHINWGWDGEQNGFFEPFLLGGFDIKIGAGINLYNDGNEKIYSRCWNDYGYLWSNPGAGPGLNVNVTEIQGNVPFQATLTTLTIPNDYVGTIALALVNESEEIIEVAENAGMYFEGNHDWDHIGYSWSGFWPVQFRDVTFNTEVRPDMHLQAVSREYGEDWKIILGSMECPSSLPVVGIKPVMAKITYNIHDPYGIIEWETKTEQALSGNGAQFTCLVKGGVAYAMLDGIFRCNGSDFGACGFNYNVEPHKENYIVDIYANRYEDLLNKTVVLQKAGTLSQLIPDKEQSLIYSLVVEGPMNYLDYDFITSNLHSLKHLDVKKTTIEESAYNRYNYLPYTAGDRLMLPEDGLGCCTWGLESFILPEDLKGMEDNSLAHQEIVCLDIPSSVEYYGSNALNVYAGGRLDYINVNNPTPFEFPTNPFTFSKNTILFVPKGSKELYANSETWGRCRAIRENDGEFVGKYIDVDSARYLILADYAVLSGKYRPHSNTITLPSFVEYEGKEYPVKGATRDCNFQYLILPEQSYFEFNWFNGNAVTTLLKANYEFAEGSNLYSDIYIPGACLSNYDYLQGRVIEMWNYQFDVKTRTIMIEPNYNIWLNIESVIINGKQVEPYNGNLYCYEMNEPLDKAFNSVSPEMPDVIIQYRIASSDVLTTHYTPEFNAALIDCGVTVGDVDGDGSITTKDINIMISGYLSPETSTLSPATADMNGDGEINTLDINILINYILNNK